MGFIAHVDSIGGLLWAVFFWNSNPIKELAVKDGVLSAVNEHSALRIEINLGKLTEIRMYIIGN
jgi:hypothetical protein